MRWMAAFAKHCTLPECWLKEGSSSIKDGLSHRPPGPSQSHGHTWDEFSSSISSSSAHTALPHSALPAGWQTARGHSSLQKLPQRAVSWHEGNEITLHLSSFFCWPPGVGICWCPAQLLITCSKWISRRRWFSHSFQFFQEFLGADPRRHLALLCTWGLQTVLPLGISRMNLGLFVCDKVTKNTQH